MNVQKSMGGPSNDGDILQYEPIYIPKGLSFDRSRRVVFVNGMQNSASDHANSARKLSEVQACPVIGVFNKSDGFGADLGQCIRDKITLVGAVAVGFSGWQKAVDAGYLAAKAKRPTLSKIDFVGTLIDGNKAAKSLYLYVASLTSDERRALKIFCHSQGNLITSNALTSVALALGEGAIGGIEVYSYGSPCRYWPNGIKHTNFAFTFDPVALLDLRAGFSTSKIGFVGVVGIAANADPMYAHSFLRYMEYDAEFVVNRYRWGSFGMTANMDEAGLAEFLVRLGNNPGRLKKIFERLKSAHWTDSDDVAYEYVTRMRKGYSTTMASIARVDSALIDLLIALLESGWTTGGERTEIDYLKTLI